MCSFPFVSLYYDNDTLPTLGKTPQHRRAANYLGIFMRKATTMALSSVMHFLLQILAWFVLTEM